MKYKMVQILGTNGSGKSVIPKMLVSKSKKFTVIRNKKGKICWIHLHDLDWYIIGKYSLEYNDTCGGADTLSDKGLKEKILETLWKRKGNILIEGIIIHSKLFVERLLELQRKHSNIKREVILIKLNTKLSECFKRIESRGGKNREQLVGRGANIISKYKGIKSMCRWAKKDDRFKLKKIDAMKTKKKMLEQFMEIVG